MSFEVSSMACWFSAILSSSEVTKPKRFVILRSSFSTVCLIP